MGHIFLGQTIEAYPELNDPKKYAAFQKATDKGGERFVFDPTFVQAHSEKVTNNKRLSIKNEQNFIKQKVKKNERWNVYRDNKDKVITHYLAQKRKQRSVEFIIPFIICTISIKTCMNILKSAID